MSIYLLAPWLKDNRYEGKKKLVLLAIAEAVNEEGRGFISQRTMMAWSGAGETYVSECVKAFVADGVLSIVEKGRGPGRATVYHLNPPTEWGCSGDPNPPTLEANPPTLDGNPPTLLEVHPSLHPSNTTDTAPADAGGARKETFAGAFYDAWKAAHGETPPRNLVGRVGREAQGLVEKDGKDPEKVMLAVRRAALSGNANVVSAYGFIVSEATSVKPWQQGKPQTQDSDWMNSPAVARMIRGAANA